jgi:hypothetical protein
VTAVPRLAYERERQPSCERYRRGQRHTGGFGADDHVDTEVPGELRAPGPEIAKERRVGVGAFH